MQSNQGITMNISIRCNGCHDPDNCPQCLALNAERNARFAPPREYSPELRLMSELHTNAADLLVVAGKIIATHDTEMVRTFYVSEIRTRINALASALDRYGVGG